MLADVRRLPFSLLFALFVGCYRSSEPEPCAVAASGRNLTEFRAEAVDLLFVMDNSRSMAPYQEALRREFPKLVRGLVTGDHDADPSTPKFPPVSSIRVGFITTDMGEAGLGMFPDDNVRTACGLSPEIANGDDARLIRISVGQNTAWNPTGLDCDSDGDGRYDVISPAELPSFLTFEAPPTEPSASEVDAFVHRASCYGLPGTTGCGMEMPLDAMLKALTPSTSPIRFFSMPGAGNELGRGDDLNSNAGWLRPDSVLAVVVLSDEDDCSTDDRRVFDWGAAAPFDEPGNPRPGDPESPYAQSFQAAGNTRCVRFANSLYGVERFVDGLLALRPDPSRIVFTAITGVPPDLVDDIDQGEGAANLGAVLGDARMAYQVRDSKEGDALADVRTACIPCPTCEEDALVATPARRIIDTGARLRARGASVLIQSICEPSFTQPVEAILETLGTAIAPACLALPVERDAAGLVPCIVTQTLPVGESCGDDPQSGLEATPIGRTADGSVICRMTQLPVISGSGTTNPPSGSGFYLDDFSAESRRCGVDEGRLVVFSGGAGLRTDVETSIDCIYQGRPPVSRVDVASACDPSDPRACALTDEEREATTIRFGIEGRDDRLRPRLLDCEPATSTCQLSCSSNADCPLGTACIDPDGDDGSRYFPRCAFVSCR